MNGTPPILLRQYGPSALVFAVLFLLPFGRWSGLPMLLMSLFGLTLLVRDRSALASDPRFHLLVALWACYALPMLFACLDAVLPAKAWQTSVASLRFLLLGVFVLRCLDAEALGRLWRWAAWLTLLWSLDALVQAAIGYNLLGMPRSPERLNGVFGPTNIKLGPVLAALSPLLLEYARRHWKRWALIAAYALLLVVIVLIGTRQAWVMFAVVTVCYLALYARRHPGRWLRSLSLILALTAAVVLVGYQASPALKERLDRSLLLLSGDPVAMDTALSHRLPIWATGLAMATSHPVNGVGPRGFRHAYAEHARAGDPWLIQGGDVGANHAHQLLLEVAAETGIPGLAGLALALLLALSHWRRAPPNTRERMLPFAIALGAMLFPVNTHLAFYSTFWSLLFWWLVVQYVARGTSTDT